MDYVKNSIKKSLMERMIVREIQDKFDSEFPQFHACQNCMDYIRFCYNAKLISRRTRNDMIDFISLALREIYGDDLHK